MTGYFQRQTTLGEQCKAAGLTRLQIAGRLNTRPTTVQAWLRGYVYMPDDAFERVAALLAERSASTTTLSEVRP